MDYIICLENKSEEKQVEYLVRESFWNVYRPGCSEHFVIHKLRDDENFVKELNFVMKKDGKIIGQNVFVKAEIECECGKNIPVLTMGPICIAPEYKRKGYGKILLDYTLQKAQQLGYGAVLIEGNIDFYGKSGFKFAKEYNIKYYGLPDGEDDSFFLCKELTKGYLRDVKGVYRTPQCYFVQDSDVEEFDKQFPSKQKLKLPGQLA